jgi:hypothetical protein
MRLGRVFVLLFAIGAAATARPSAGAPPEATGRPILDQHNTDAPTRSASDGTAGSESRTAVARVFAAAWAR